MRFIVKSAFWLGLIAFLVPFGGRGTSNVDISWFGALAGAQQALHDLGGFCDRAPAACRTGQEVAVFAGERIGDGFALAYDFVEKRRGEGHVSPAAGQPETVDHLASNTAEPRSIDVPSTEVFATDPMATGALPLPHAYIAPKRPSAAPTETAGRQPAPARIAIPTPAPRS